MPAKSEEAKANVRRQNRENYAWYKSKGICPKCRKEWASPERVFCAKCLKKKCADTMKHGSEHNAQKCKERRERLKAQGLCVSCGKPAVKGRSLCAACARRNSEAQQVRKMKKRLQREAEAERK